MARPANPAHARDAATGVVRALHGAGHVAYFAGGCVRDELLGLEPTDYDVATDATPERVGGLFPRTMKVGAAFGVVLVRQAGVTVEVATFRADGPYSDQRRPDTVRFSDPPSDAARRDFTVNALFLDPLGLTIPGRAVMGAARPGAAPGQPPAFRSLPSGTVIDYAGGLLDLERRVIRAVGDPERRLAEDHLRALRAVRLSARLGFWIEPGTADAIRRHARELRGVSRERIGDEVRRMLTHPSRAIAAGRLHELGLDGPTLDVPASLGIPLTVLRSLGSDSPPYPTCLAAWATDRGALAEPDKLAGIVSAWRAALCLSNDERQEFEAALRGALLLEREWDGWPVARRKRAGASPWFAESLRLVAGRDQARAVLIDREIGELAATTSGLAPAPWITGDDLVAWGLRPGRGFKALLDEVYDAQLDGRVGDRAGAERLARELARTLGV